MPEPRRRRSVEDMTTHSTSQTVAARSMRVAEHAFAAFAALVAGVWVAGLFPQDPTAAVFGIPAAISTFIAVSWAAQALRCRYLGSGSR